MFYYKYEVTLYAIHHFQSTADVYSIPRDPIQEQPSNKADPIMGFLSKPVVNPGTGQVVSYLPDSGQVIRALPPEKVPKEVYPDGE